MSGPAGTGRTYRLAPPDRTGAILGLSHRSVAVLAVGLVAAVLAFTAGAAPVGIAAAAAAVGLVVVRLDGGPLLDTLPVRLGWARSRAARRNTWRATLPLPVEASSPPWPPTLDGLRLLAVGPELHGWAGAGEIGVVWDQRCGLVSATVAVSGGHFGLVDPGEQDSAVARWGEALAGFVRERAGVAQVCWTEWAAPAGISEHLSWLADHCHQPDSPAAHAYRDLVAGAAPAATGHQVTVTVTVQVGRPTARAGARTARSARTAAIGVLGGEVRLFADRLTAGGLKVSLPWNMAGLAAGIRARLDPAARPATAPPSASLGMAAGLVRPADAGPLATEAAWEWWRTDGSYHRSFYVSDWPRLAMPAGWLGPLLGWAGCVRSLSVVMEPVSPRRSAQEVRRAATKLDSDSAHRSAQGFRVGAGLRRTAEAVAEREEELVAGYREMTYAGIVTLTAGSVEDLDRRSDDLTQTAGASGVELRALHGRHDQAFAVGLPVGRGLTPPRRWGPR